MCGIVGAVNLSNKSRMSEEDINRMADTMVHRGPDDSGIYVDDSIALGHRRLTIIDLSSLGRQPMIDSTGKVTIVYNGEIYNYIEIKEILLKKGYVFNSNTDTEVILNAYLEYGIECLEQFNGMFAFALYDKRNNKVFIVRDRIGIKPLYYTQHDGRLIFSSEIKAILEYPDFKTSVNLIGVSSYLSCRYPIRENTLFENISSLLPGHYLEISAEKVTRKQYWDLPVCEEKEDHGEEYYLRNVHSLLEMAVKYRMRSDVPFGAYLSGGLDSSIIVAMMSKFTDEPVKTFTIGFDVKGYNEFDYARLVADRYQTNHHEITLSSKHYIDNMIKLIKYKDSPLGVANEPALHVMSKELKKYITVVLSGEGADEIFGGYGRIFRSPYDYQRLCELSDGNQIGNETVLKLLTDNLRKKYGDKRFSCEQEHFQYLYNYTSWRDKENFLHNDVINCLDHDQILNNLFAEQFSKVSRLSTYDKYMWLFEKMHIVGLLHRVDMTTMATSVEARVPFVDHHLVEFALSMPVKYKLKWKSLLDKIAASVHNCDNISEIYDTPKYILKKAFVDDLPDKVIRRKKMGFPVPVHKWFGSDFNDFAKEILLDDRAKNRKVYNSRNLESLLNQKELFKEHKVGLKVWMLINLELWYREYMD